MSRDRPSARMLAGVDQALAALEQPDVGQAENVFCAAAGAYLQAMLDAGMPRSPALGALNGTCFAFLAAAARGPDDA